ncbi:antibiotic biosynthesis monooxygenase family protein [Terrabacter sp. 2YAF2]|uniref:antibiotic biosynthesis monooxygenase family protein n=1 Tax=Terrabacter sp. 2YAF2 TaxID=3233026 RepID=UPI003F9D6BBF
MYTRHTTFPLKPDSASKAEQIGRKYGKLLHDLPGHVSTVMVVDDTTFTSVSTWDTREHAEAVRQTRDDAQNELGDLLSAAPSTVISATLVHDVD